MQTKMLYWVDAHGAIVRAEMQISEESARRDPVFADPFHAPDIVGRKLFSFIRGDAVRHFYALLHTQVLEHDRHYQFHYRCDGPAVRRDMTMSLVPDNSLVRYESIVLKETERAVPTPRPTPTAPAFVTVCSMCNNYRYPRSDPKWKEIDQLPSESRLPEHFDFTHTLCPPCMERCMAELAPEDLTNAERPAG
jgi:hypothetical protein